MAYDLQLATRVRAYLSNQPGLEVAEKKMFRGLAFIVNGKMCINISGENLMCRFEPELTQEIALRKGFLKMEMRGRVLKGYCYVEPFGFKNAGDFRFWLDLCLSFNDRAKASVRRRRK